MDPGNWATDIAGGSKYGYSLIWVLVMSNIMAFILQGLSARLGVVARKDLAQISREQYPRKINFALYGLAEVAIAACDLAEVLGMAIGLQLLFGMPIMVGVLISIADTFILLLLQRLGMRKMEAFIISLVAVIGLCFFFQLFMAEPSLKGIVGGLKPQIPDAGALYILIGIIGATVMPHNLYLHSSLVQTRKINRSKEGIRQAIKLNLWDSGIALNMALLVNASILILAAAAFHSQGYTGVAEIQDAHKLLAPLLGASAPILFAVALVASGQSSTITGTLAGQIVMEGYLRLRLPIWLRRLITRALAVVPAAIIVYIYGEEETGAMLIFSQVILSFQLGFAIIPLIHAVSSRKIMGSFAIGLPLKIFAWVITSAIIVFNIYLVSVEIEPLLDWFGSDNVWIKTILISSIALMGALLVYVIIYPLIKNKKGVVGFNIHNLPSSAEISAAARPRIIGVTLDYTSFDRVAIAQLAQLYRPEDKVFLIHVNESPGALLTESRTGDHESHADELVLNHYIERLAEAGIAAEARMGYGRRTKAIVDIVNQEHIELLIMASHGHHGLKDLLLGETIESVRHAIEIPVLAAR